MDSTALAGMRYDDSFDDGERWRDACTGGPFSRRVVAWSNLPRGLQA